MLFTFHTRDNIKAIPFFFTFCLFAFLPFVQRLPLTAYRLPLATFFPATPATLATLATCHLPLATCLLCCMLFSLTFLVLALATPGKGAARGTGSP